MLVKKLKFGRPDITSAPPPASDINLFGEVEGKRNKIVTDVKSHMNAVARSSGAALANVAAMPDSGLPGREKR